MLKFFRTIRRRLLDSGSLRKYLVYAIGEILLVVIGILIALQVNNWNNEKQQRKLEIKYLTEIRNSLRSDLSDINFNIKFNKSKLNSNHIVLQYLNGAIKYADTLDFHFSNIMFTTRTLVNSSAYENLKSRGLEIISNDSLRRRITTLYSFDFHNLVDFETKDDHAFQYSLFLPEVTQAIKIDSMNLGINPYGKAEPTDKLDIKNNASFKNVIILNTMLREYMVYNYQNLKIKVESTILGLTH